MLVDLETAIVTFWNQNATLKQWALWKAKAPAETPRPFVLFNASKSMATRISMSRTLAQYLVTFTAVSTDDAAERISRTIAVTMDGLEVSEMPMGGDCVMRDFGSPRELGVRIAERHDGTEFGAQVMFLVKVDEPRRTPAAMT